MRRMCAMVVLAVVVLWTAAPALACVSAPAGHECCAGGMQDGSAMVSAPVAAQMSVDNSCCVVSAPVSSVPAERAAAAELDGSAVPAGAGVAGLSAVVAPGLPFGVDAAKAPPPSSFPGNISILRI